MKSSYVVIGANFGDEAKGKTVDALVAKIIENGGKPVVCRFNGGGQAGHTVEVNGVRHVFSHVGAGALRGALTYLSQHFITNFFTLKKELEELYALGKVSEVVISPRSKVTMVVDMLINSMIEIKRGDGRHGSCGLGINECVTRSEAEGGRFMLNAHHVELASFNPDDGVESLAKRMFDICNEWVPMRLYQLGFTKSEVPDQLIQMTSMESLRQQASEMIGLVKRSVTVMRGNFIASGDYQVVFEGAQGLMLDEYLGFFPHVTRSITGLPNAIEAARKLGVTELIPVYTTRAYLTRHGAGPLSHEGEQFAENQDIVDKTNIENKWQGKIRYAPLNLSLMNNFINEDIRRAQLMAPQHNVTIASPQIALHCLDQIGEYAIVYGTDNKPQKVEAAALARFVTRELGFPVTMTGHSPSSVLFQ